MQPNDIEYPQIYTVSRFNSEARFLLEDTFYNVWVEGEISNFAAPHSGHWYFSLKDASAQVRCALFKGNQRKLGFTPKDGMHVLLKARASLYENRGDFQLIAEFMEERGEGKLRRAYEALKKKLEAAGLFDPAHKKPLPAFPQQIGVITSATGAAIRDILTVLKRRFPCVPVIIYPTPVQGASAAPTLVKALQLANQRQECDVLILARGGGSLEDLWPFNEEIVAHAIYASNIPIISGVGHEVDFTITDYVADIRAPTPSVAAEIATPSKVDLLHRLRRFNLQLTKQMQTHLSHAGQQLTWMQKHLLQQHPKRKLREKMQQLDFIELTFTQLQHKMINQFQVKVGQLEGRLNTLTPSHRIRQSMHHLHLVQQQLNHLVFSHLNHEQTLLANAATKLNALSPLATLSRGYALATKNQHILRDANEVKKGDAIRVRLMRGEIECVVEKTIK